MLQRQLPSVRAAFTHSKIEKKNRETEYFDPIEQTA